MTQRARKSRTVHDALREIARALPQTEETVSHGMPHFRVAGGRSFAMLAVNHHGDGRVALWLRAPAGAQAHYAVSGSRHYFVPPYFGVSGWLGLRLDRRPDWSAVAGHLLQAWREGAPSKLRGAEVALPAVAPPEAGLSVEELDPMHSKPALRAVEVVRAICLALPQTSEGLQFGKPVWRVGKRVFAQVWRYDGPVCAAFWVGIERQGLMTLDPRYTLPAYLGHNGWIALDVTRTLRQSELRSLAAESHAHFAPRPRAATRAAR
jgi:hypothetical protein